MEEPTKPASDAQRRKAQRLIDRGDYRVYDLCAERAQIFDNVKHMKWLLDAVIDEIL